MKRYAIEDVCKAWHVTVMPASRERLPIDTDEQADEYAKEQAEEYAKEQADGVAKEAASEAYKQAYYEAYNEAYDERYKQAYKESLEQLRDLMTCETVFRKIGKTLS